MFRVVKASRFEYFIPPIKLSLRSHWTSKSTKILIYKVLIRPVLKYASEIWTVSNINGRRLSLFERKMIGCIFGTKQGNGTWRRRYNYEFDETFNESNIFNYIKIKELAWAGHFNAYK
jgi:hypothetical protein